MANSINNFAYTFLNTDDSDELNIIRHSPYFNDDDLLKTSTFHNKMHARRTRIFFRARM